MRKITRKASRAWHHTKAYLAGCLAVIVLLALAGFFGLSFIAALLDAPGQRHTDPKKIEARMEFQKSALVAGALVHMKVSLLDEDGTPYYDIARSDGKYFHVFVTNDTFRFFGHDHPDEYVSNAPASFARGEFTLPIVFPEAGTYSVAVRFTNTNRDKITKLFLINVPDRSGAFSTTDPHTGQDMRKTKKFDGYTIRISPSPENITPCAMTRISYDIEKNGSRITDLDPVEASPEGSALALAAWDESMRTFIYAPAKLSWNARPVAIVSFPKAGGYHLFAEFKRDGEVVPTSFFVPVTGSRECEK